MSKPTSRPLPQLTSLNAFFWTAGREGLLKILRCNDCHRWLHPPSPVCPFCLSRNLTPSPTSGFATIETLTVNFHPWTPDLTVPYTIAIVSLKEQLGIRLTTNIVDCDPDSVRIGDTVRVVFEQHDDVWLPLFTPV